MDLVSKHLTPQSIQQYQREERSLIFNRIRNSRYQIRDIIHVMTRDTIAPQENIDQLKEELAKHYNNTEFLRCKTMGHILRISLKILIKGK